MRYTPWLALFALAGVAFCDPVFNGAHAYVDPRGFIVKVPSGWHANPLGTNQGLRGVAVGAPDGSTASIVFGDSAASAQKMVDDVVAQAVLPGAHLVKNRVDHANGYLELREYTFDLKGPRRLRMMFYARQGGYTAWFMSAAQGSFEQDAASLVDVLNSFHFNRTAAAAADAIEMHTAKPEGAFQVGFPAGWSVEARTVRSGIGLYHTISAFAPGHTSSVHSWSPWPLQFTMPTPLGTRLGHGPGYRYVDNGVQMLVAPYMAPSKCLEALARSTPELHGIEVKSVHRIPVESSGWSRNEEDYIDIDYPEAGSQGGAIVRTYSIEGPQAGLWWADVCVWLAKPGHEAEGKAALSTAIKTLRMNPEWVAQQNKAVAQQSQILQNEHAALDDIMQRNVDNQNAAREGVARRGDDIVQGRDSYVDNDGTLHHIQIDATSNYYWKGAGGTVTGTATDNPPGPDVTRLLHVP